jgi:F0F1-type ATP synthase epsilon subunit
MENKISATSLHVLIRNRDALVFEGDVKAISTSNERGPLDVLPEHENFISIITSGVDLTLMDEEKKSFALENTSGLLRVSDNTVSIFLGVSITTANTVTPTQPNSQAR